jgi:hypothetical protein
MSAFRQVSCVGTSGRHILAMEFPTPADPANSPIWENYVVAQAAQAALGLIPVNAVAVGVQVDESDVRLVFRLRQESEQDAKDVEDVTAELEVLLGPDVRVHSKVEVQREPDLSPRDSVRWFFRVRSNG